MEGRPKYHLQREKVHLKVFIYTDKILLPYRMLKELLEDLIFFVLGKENSKSCKPLDVTGNPSRERQKLCREQNILAEVMFMCMYSFMRIVYHFM